MIWSIDTELHQSGKIPRQEHEMGNWAFQRDQGNIQKKKKKKKNTNWRANDDLIVGILWGYFVVVFFCRLTSLRAANNSGLVASISGIGRFSCFFVLGYMTSRPSV